MNSEILSQLTENQCSTEQSSRFRLTRSRKVSTFLSENTLFADKIKAIFKNQILLMPFSLFARKSKEETFWNWFKKNHQSYEPLARGSLDSNLFEELDNNIKTCSHGLQWEIGIGQNEEFELVISAGGFREFFQDVIDLVDSAPTIEGWTFTAFKQPGEVGGTLKMNGKEYRVDDFQFGFVGEDKMGLVLYHPDYDDPDINNAGIIILDSIIGEYDAATGINQFAVLKLPDNYQEYEIYPMREIAKRFNDR